MWISKRCLQSVIVNIVLLSALNFCSSTPKKIGDSTNFANRKYPLRFGLQNEYPSHLKNLETDGVNGPVTPYRNKVHTNAVQKVGGLGTYKL